VWKLTYGIVSSWFHFNKEYLFNIIFFNIRLNFSLSLFSILRCCRRVCLNVWTSCSLWQKHCFIGPTCQWFSTWDLKGVLNLVCLSWPLAVCYGHRELLSASVPHMNDMVQEENTLTFFNLILSFPDSKNTVFVCLADPKTFIQYIFLISYNRIWIL